MVNDDNKYKIIWTEIAKNDLKDIYEFYKVKSLIAAKKIIKEIAIAPKSVYFPEQNQVESLEKGYRRIIIRNYKMFYRINEKENILLEL